MDEQTVNPLSTFIPGKNIQHYSTDWPPKKSEYVGKLRNDRSPLIEISRNETL